MRDMPQEPPERSSHLTPGTNESSSPGLLPVPGGGETDDAVAGAAVDASTDDIVQPRDTRDGESPPSAYWETGWGEGESPEPSLDEKPTPSRRRRLLLALLAIQVILIVAGLVFWYRTPSAPALPPIAAQPASRVNGGATYESALPVAQAQADAWIPGARLLNAAMQVDWDWTVPDTPVTILPPTGWLTYTFIAPWQPWGKSPGAASLDVIFDRLSGEIVRQDTLGWATAPEWREPPPPAANNSTQATLRAEAGGGTAFRRECSDLRHLSRTFPVAAGRTEWPQHWVIIYEDTRVREQQGLLVRIDARTGEVLQTRQDAPGCPETP